MIVSGWRYYHRLTSGLVDVVFDTIEKFGFRKEKSDSSDLEILSKNFFGNGKFLIVSLLITINTTNTNNNPLRAYACV